jgi:hypothetical protein
MSIMAMSIMASAAAQPGSAFAASKEKTQRTAGHEEDMLRCSVETF